MKKLTLKNIEKACAKLKGNSIEIPISIAMTTKTKSELMEYVKANPDSKKGITKLDYRGMKIYSNEKIDEFLNTFQIDGLPMTKDQENLFFKLLDIFVKKSKK